MTDAILDVYRQVRAPAWAAPNLDGLADVLRDLSWLPAGPVPIRLPAGSGADASRLLAVLSDAETASSDTARPVRLLG